MNFLKEIERFNIGLNKLSFINLCMEKKTQLTQLNLNKTACL